VHEVDASFILQDVRIVSNLVGTFHVRWKNICNLSILVGSILRSRAVIVWFASGQAAVFSFVIAKLLRKQFVAMAGGSEVASDRRIHGMGVRSDIRFAFTKVLLNNADFVLSVSRFTLKEVLSIARPKRFMVMYHGIDTKAFCSQTTDKDIVLTVAVSGLWRKGIDRFLNVASLLPHRKFVLAGGGTDQVLWRASLPNLFITGKLPDLKPLFERAKFYCQLSRHEGFGVAVAEAMACKCVPVVSDSGALPEVVGCCGVVVPNGDPAKAAKAIEGLWDHGDELAESARDRVVSLYSVEQRVEGFRTVLRELGCL